MPYNISFRLQKSKSDNDNDFKISLEPPIVAEQF